MKKPSLLVIFLTVFIDLIGFGIVLPLLPRYSERFGAEGFLIGLIVASFSVMQFFLAPMWGRLSDRVGRRPVLLLSNAGSVLSYAMFAGAAWPGLSPQGALVLLLVSRVFAGACGANISVASAYIADVTPPEERSKGMGLIGMAFGLGFILGPALGAVSAAWFGLMGPGCVAAALCAANLGLAWFILVESRKPGSAPATGRPKLAQWAHTLRQPRVGVLVGLYFVATFCFACFETTLPLLLGSPAFHPDDFRHPAGLLSKLRDGPDPVSRHLRSRLPAGFMARAEEPLSRGQQQRLLFQGLNELMATPGLYAEGAWAGVELREATRSMVAASGSADTWRRAHRLLLEDAYPAEIQPQAVYFDERGLGYVFAYCGLVSALIQGGVIGRLVKRFGEARLVFGSLVGVALSMVWIPYAGGWVAMLLALAVFSAGSGLNRAPTLGLISIHTPASEQGATLGVTQSMGTLARILGPVFATTVYASAPHATYLAGAALALGAAGFAWARLCRARGEPAVDGRKTAV